MVIADRPSQTIATSRSAPEGARPQLLGLVNAPIEWGGATWGAYAWDFVVNRTARERNELLLHELFNGVQPQLGLRVPALPPEHLDATDGRYWLRLEWRALARALRESGEERNLAVRDAGDEEAAFCRTETGEPRDDGVAPRRQATNEEPAVRAGQRSR